MEKNASRSASLLLAGLLLSSSLASCGSAKSNENAVATSDLAGTETAETTAAETELSDDLGEMDFGGASFRVITGKHQEYPTYTYSANEQNGDLLNDALYERNTRLEERFNVNFEENVLDDIFKVNDTVKNFTYAGDNSYELAMMIDRFALKAGMDGQLIQYGDLPNINLEKPYWNQKVSEDFSIDGKLFFSYGDDNLVFFQSTTMLAFNKKLHDDFSLDNIYDLVRDGKWTIDRYFAMCEAVSADIDGDGEYTMNDRYGQMVTTNMHYPNFWLQSGYRLILKDSDDIPYFSVPGNDGLLTLMSDIYERSNAGNITYNIELKSDWKSSYDSTNTYNSVMMLFMSGNSLFVSASLTSIPVARSMETDFGIVPYPKNEETFAGDGYGSRTFGGFPYVVPITVTDTEMVSAIMEASACEASKLVIPVLYDQVLKTKSARDTDSEEMLDMMRANRLTDLGETYWWDEIESVYEQIYREKKGDFTSKTASVESKVNELLEKNIEFFKGLE